MLFSKREQTQQWMEQHSELQMRCIHCHQTLLIDKQGLFCSNGHRFDIGKQGYYFISKHTTISQYSKRLFMLRRKIISESGFYSALHQRIQDFINEEEVLSILDAGCGEGSHLFRIRQNSINNSENFRLVGVDLSKEGIQLATDYNGNALFLVSDLANLPFQAGQFDLILSILSPANYREFNRVLKQNGYLFKIIPNPSYLGEIRETMKELGIQDSTSYSNTDVVTVFKSQYLSIDQERIVDEVVLSEEEKQAIVSMTPLTWNLNDIQRNNLIKKLPAKMTLDLTLLIAKNSDLN